MEKCIIQRVKIGTYRGGDCHNILYHEYLVVVDGCPQKVKRIGTREELPEIPPQPFSVLAHLKIEKQRGAA